VIVCPSCGQKNEQHFKFCLGCGTELPSNAVMPTPSTRGWLEDEAIPTSPGGIDAPSPAPIATALEDARAASAPSSARLCPSCGTVVPSTFAFCGQCGGRIDAPPSTIRNSVSGGVTQGKLVLIRSDGTEGGTHPLSLGDTTVGRGGGPLFDADGYLSPRHARVTLTSEGARVEDLDSLNGVFIRMHEEEQLESGSIFRIGQELLRFEVLPPAEPLADGTHIMGSPHGGTWGRLVLLVSSQQDGSAFPLGGESVILGRERGDILFAEDGYVSGTHARLSQRNGLFYLVDLNSSNGTFLRIRGARDLPNGALLLMGQQLFRVNFA
jgi:pSer/pThr/pTyr-binding forkhead associated (FHA) protein